LFEDTIHFLAGEMLSVAEQFLTQQMHPTVIISAYRLALEDMVDILREKVRYDIVLLIVCQTELEINFTQRYLQLI
jgi:Ni,Fe-hydrogenase maturation factor